MLNHQARAKTYGQERDGGSDTYLYTVHAWLFVRTTITYIVSKSFRIPIKGKHEKLVYISLVLTFSSIQMK